MASDQEAEIDQLPGDAVVLRGGPMAGKLGSDTMYQNAYEEFQESGRWALSVYSWPDLSASEIAAKWRYRGQHMQESLAKKIREAGFEVIPEPRFPGDTHALLMLGAEPTEDTWEALRPLFGPEMRNPHYRKKPN